MRFLLPLFAFLAIVAPAQADITASTITTPQSPHYVLSHGTDATVDVAGTAKGVGNVDIVCVDASSTTVLATDVPVAGDGTFSRPAVSLDAIVNAYGWGLTCRLHAVPAGTTPTELERFRGPVLAISLLTEEDANGNAADGIDDYHLSLAGADRSTDVRGFGTCSMWSQVLDPDTLGEAGMGHACSGGTVDSRELPLNGVTVDGQAAYPPAQAVRDVAGYGTGGFAGSPALYVRSVDFDADTGAAAVAEEDLFAKCGPEATYPPTQFTCTQFDPVPVKLRRTTSVSAGDHVVRVVDHWSSTDGQAHRLDLALTAGQCCEPQYEYRFPGQSGYAQHGPGAEVAGPLAGPVFARDAAGGGPGAFSLPGQAADGARFVAADAFGLLYRDRKIPATGELTFTHYYVTTRSAAELDAAAAKLIASLPKPGPAPHPVTPHPVTPHPVTPPEPRFSRHGTLHLRRLGRTYRVTTRDRVVCACTVHVSGRWVVPTDLKAFFGRTNAVRFRLTRDGARRLRRAGHLRVRYVLAAPGVTKRRTVRLRTGTS